MARDDRAVHNVNERGTDSNPDPLTGQPGAHPVGTGVGAAMAGAAAGAAGGLVGGPIGAAVGAVVGGVAGGLAGKGVAESIDPTVEDRYSHGEPPIARITTPRLRTTSIGRLIATAGSRKPSTQAGRSTKPSPNWPVTGRRPRITPN